MKEEEDDFAPLISSINSPFLLTPLSPSLSSHGTVSNFNVRDLGTIAGTTVISAPVGHLIGESENEEENERKEETRITRRPFFFFFFFFDLFLLLTLLFPLSLNPLSLATINQKKKKKTGLKNKTPRPAMWAAALVGGTAGFLLSYQASAARLMGFAPNDKEVETGLRKR